MKIPSTLRQLTQSDNPLIEGDCYVRKDGTISATKWRGFIIGFSFIDTTFLRPKSPQQNEILKSIPK